MSLSTYFSDFLASPFFPVQVSVWDKTKSARRNSGLYFMVRGKFQQKSGGKVNTNYKIPWPVFLKDY